MAITAIIFFLIFAILMYKARTRYNANKRAEILYNFEEYSFPKDSFELTLYEGTNHQRKELVQLKIDKTLCEVDCDSE